MKRPHRLSLVPTVVLNQILFVKAPPFGFEFDAGTQGLKRMQALGREIH